MNNSEWVDIKILADALGFKTETLRRGCASEKYVCRLQYSFMQIQTVFGVFIDLVKYST